MRTLLAALAALCISSVASASERVALTFDDGPGPYTAELLDVLKREGVKATFFVVGQRVAQSPSLVKRMVAEGHEVGNHSWSHPVLTSANVGSQISRTDQAIINAVGYQPKLLRAPYGATRYVGSCYGGRPFVGWSVDTRDWRHKNSSATVRIASSAHGGSVVLMHDIHRSSVAAVPTLIALLKRKGVQFVRASEIVGTGCHGTRTASR
jgi:peptidoglycan/xylan/chitin deacetylase (PgdA/CDA1 family)